MKNWHIAGWIASGLVALVSLASWHSETVARAKLAATLAIEDGIIKSAALDRLAHAKQDAQRDAQTANEIEGLKSAVARIKAPIAITGWSQKQLENAIQGIKISVPAATPEAPHPQAVATIPEASLVGLRDAISSCQVNTLKLSTCLADLASRDAQLKADDVRIGGLQKEKQAAVKATNGSFWERLKIRGKYAIIGGGITVVLLCATGHCPK